MSVVGERYLVEVQRSGEWWVLRFPALADRLLGQVRDLASIGVIAAEALMLATARPDGTERLIRPVDIEVRLVP